MRALRISTKITNRESGSFKQYLSDISNIEMFTSDEEAECAIRASTGDKDAIDELVRRNLRFVVSVAKQHETPTVSLEDLVNEGNIGLISAVQTYDHTSGFKFITYAVHWVRKMILEYLAKNGRIVRLPSNKITGLSKYNQHVVRLEQKYGRDVDNAEIANELSEIMSLDEINEIQTIAAMNFESLDVVVGDSDSGTSYYEMLPDSGIEATDHLITTADLKVQLERALKVLKPRDRQIISDLFGLNGTTPMTLKEVGDKVGLTREMVRQIKERSLTKLQKSFIK
jgi:RNA polymerase primary sigma factor